MCALFAFAMQSQDNHDHRPTEVDKDGDGSIDFDEFLAMMIDIRDNSESKPTACRRSPNSCTSTVRFSAPSFKYETIAAFARLVNQACRCLLATAGADH